MELDPAEVQREPEKALIEILKEREYVYLSSPDFRRATIRFDKETQEYRCLFPVSYIDAAEWLALIHEDQKNSGWTSLPKEVGDDKWLETNDSAQLLAILDSSKIEFDRTTVVRREQKSDKFLAAWNYLEFRVPIAKKISLITLIRHYLSGFPPDTKINVYNTQP